MRTVRAVQTSFTAGEIDPRLDARIEVSRYYSAAARLRNVTVLPQGGIQRRPGLRHIAALPAGATAGLRLVPFAFSAGQTFLVAVTAGAFQVYRGSDGTLVFSGTGPWTADIAAQVNWAQSVDTLILFHPDLPPHRIRREGADTNWSSAPIALANIPAHDFGGGPEPVISAARGWPECGTFHHGRLWMGGLRSRPATLLASRAGSQFDFQTGTLADHGMLLTIDSDQLNQVHQLMSHRGLLIFTSGAEHAITVAPPITATNVAVEGQSRRGIKRYASLGEIDGAILFIQRGGAALRQFTYSEIEQSWQADLLSLLAPHLISDPFDVVIRKSAAQDDADLVFLPDSTGLTVLSTLRSQEVVAFSRWTANGQVMAAAALANAQVFLAVLRDGAPRLLLLDRDCLLDHSLRFHFGSPVSVISGLGHLAGRQAVLLLDGRPEGVATVPGDGVLALPRACLRAEIGLGFEVLARTMPIEPRDQSGAMIGRKSRFMRVAVRVHESGPFEASNAALAVRVLGSLPAPPLDTSPPSLPVPITDEFIVDGMLGWHARQFIEIRQPPTTPAPLTVQAIAMTIALGD